MNVIITGGTKGIGRAIAEVFAREGHELMVCARSSGDLDSMKASWLSQYSSQLHTSVVDVSKKSDVIAFGYHCLEVFSQVDILVNNAGVFLPGELCEEEDGHLEMMMNTNLYSAYHLTRVIAPSMKQRQHGHIINICSVASLKAYNHGGSYSISKYALAGFNANLREELKSTGVRVTGVFPGATWSASWEGADVEKDRLMDAHDVASMLYTSCMMRGNAVVEDIIMRPQLGDL